MSRIGRMPITVPSGVEVTLEPGRASVTGPKGTLERTIPAEITFERTGDTLVAVRPSDSGEHRSLHGLTRTLVANMVQGVTVGFEKNLEIHGVGYRCVAKPEGIELALGYSHPIRFPAPEGIAFEVPSPTRITVRGADKELVGQVAAEIRAMRKPDPYKQKGVRYAGERIRKKAGKASK
ncbi:MAG TPA: 50S ribosomal protein L6 [Actinomycetota bacterium]|nr:50S ribosomal protein L6 [Actinomycetota bacterium]